MESTRPNPTLSSPDWLNRVVDVDANRSIQDIRELFSQCGEIIGIYPWKSEKSPQQHYFIEFNSKSGVNSARALGKLNHHLSVHALSMVPQLIERYRAVAPRSSSSSSSSSYRPQGHANQPVAVDSPPRESSVGPRRKGRRGGEVTRIKREGGDRSIQASSSSMLISSSSSASNFIEAAKAFAPMSVDRSHSEGDKENDSRFIQHYAQTPPPLLSSMPSSASVASIVHAHIPTSAAPFGSKVDSQTHIVVYVCGEPITFDLDWLEDDPQPIIALLKTADAYSRHNWMVVGGRYQMKGNAPAAICVVNTMIEVLTRSGVCEEDLKPAYLMLSACQRDLGRRVRTPDGKDSPESKKHFDESIKWLQKVYGIDVPRPEAQEVMFTKPQAAPPRASSPISRSRQRTASSQGTSSASSTQHSHVQILQREISSLRDRLHSLSSQLTAAQAHSEQQSADLASERSLRRSAQSRLKEAETALEGAKRMEGFALERVKKEVEARRAAEERERASVERVAVERREIVEEVSEVLRRTAAGIVEGGRGGGQRTGTTS